MIYTHVVTGLNCFYELVYDPTTDTLDGAGLFCDTLPTNLVQAWEFMLTRD